MEEKDIKKERKYRNQFFFVWLVIFVLVYALCSQFVGRLNTIFGKNALMYFIVLFIGGYVVATIIYELGKLIFGKIAGYHLVSFNLFGLTFYKDNENKTRFKLSPILDYGSKTIMAPNKTKTNLSLFLLGGTIFTLIIMIGAIVASYFIGNFLEDETITYISYLISIIALVIVILHVAPFLNDDFNDGFTLRVALTHKGFVETYNQILEVDDYLNTGRGKLIYFENIDYSNPLHVRAGLLNMYYFLYQERYEEAKNEIIKALDNTQYLTEEEHGLLISNKYYFLLMNGNEDLVGEEFYALDKAIRKKSIKDNRYETLKTALLVASLVDSSFDLYEYLYSRIDKLNNQASPIRQEVETKLIQKALSYIEKKKTDWFREEE